MEIEVSLGVRVRRETLACASGVKTKSNELERRKRSDRFMRLSIPHTTTPKANA
jgi:hypothetical protein